MTESRPTSRALRTRFEQAYALPLARRLLEMEPRCQSVLFTIGQYWCDEAIDAVHHEVLLCTEREPVWPEAARATQESIRGHGKHDGDDLVYQQLELVQNASLAAFGNRWACPLDDNGDMIVAFASHCPSVGDQEMPHWESHVPYCIVRRPADGAPSHVEVIGTCHRPAWEDRWDVLEQDGVISGFDDERGPAAAPVAPREEREREHVDPTVEPRTTGPWVYFALLAVVVAAALLLSR